MSINNEKIIGMAKKFINDTSLNCVEELGGMKIYQEPLVHFAGACDSLFTKLREPEVVRKEHTIPEDWVPGAQAVISYFLPFSEEVRQSNHIEGLPSTNWVYARIEGEACNNALKQFIIEQLEAAGGKAIAPTLDSRFSVVENKSNWSERHVAYIAGLGTFGLNKSLLTVKGCAGRYGSIVTNLEFKVNERPYQEIYQYCTWCGDCIVRCPSNAITEEGKDVPTCSYYIDTEIKTKFAPRYGCGKCQTAVMCEGGLP